MHPDFARTSLLRRALRRAVHLVQATVHALVNVPSWLRMLRPEVYVVSGREKSSQLPLRVLCAVRDDERDRTYFLTVVFGDNYEERSLGRYWIWNLARAHRDAGSDCGLIVAQLRQSHFQLTPWKRWFYIPTWLWGEISLPRDARANQKVNGDLRRIRRHKLEYEITRDPEKFDDFYHNMYLPYIKDTFGKCAWYRDYEDMKSTLSHGDLQLIRQGDKTIAGQIIVHFPEGSCIPNIGVRDGNRDYVQQGASCALYHYGLQYMDSLGIKRAWVSWSRPFLRDGVLRFKKKWSQQIVDVETSPHGFALRASVDCPAAAAFLGNNPFMEKRGDKYFGAVFSNDERLYSDEDLQTLQHDYFHPGMTSLDIYLLSCQHPPVLNFVPAQLRSQITLRGAADVPGDHQLARVVRTSVATRHRSESASVDVGPALAAPRDAEEPLTVESEATPR